MMQNNSALSEAMNQARQYQKGNVQPRGAANLSNQYGLPEGAQLAPGTQIPPDPHAYDGFIQDPNTGFWQPNYKYGDKWWDGNGNVQTIGYVPGMPQQEPRQALPQQSAYQEPVAGRPEVGLNQGGYAPMPTQQPAQVPQNRYSQPQLDEFMQLLQQFLAQQRR